MVPPARIRLERVVCCVAIILAAVVGYRFGARLSPGGPSLRTVERRAPLPSATTPVAQAAPDVRASNSTSPSAVPKPDRPTLYQQVTAALNEPISTERWMMLAHVLEGLTADNWRSAFQALDDERRLQGKEHPDALAFLVRRAGEVVGLDAVSYLREKNDRDAVASALTGWASKQPTDALDWLAKQSEKDRAELAGHAIRGLSLAEPDLAISYLEQTPVAERARYTPNLLATIERTAGLEQTQRLVEGMIERARAAGTLGEPYMTDVFRDLAEIKVRRANVTGNVDSAIAWIDQHVGQPYMNYEAVRNSAGQLAQSDPQKALAWIGSVNTRATFPASVTPVGYGTVLSTWVSQAGFEPVAQWLTANSQHVAYDRMAGYFVEFSLERNPQIATAVVAAMQNPAARAAAQEKLKQAISARTPGR